MQLLQNIQEDKNNKKMEKLKDFCRFHVKVKKFLAGKYIWCSMRWNCQSKYQSEVFDQKAQQTTQEQDCPPIWKQPRDENWDMFSLMVIGSIPHNRCQIASTAGELWQQKKGIWQIPIVNTCIHLTSLSMIHPWPMTHLTSMSMISCFHENSTSELEIELLATVLLKPKLSYDNIIRFSIMVTTIAHFF